MSVQIWFAMISFIFLYKGDHDKPYLNGSRHTRMIDLASSVLQPINDLHL